MSDKEEVPEEVEAPDVVIVMEGNSEKAPPQDEDS
jgi:hypothetical protein